MECSACLRSRLAGHSESTDSFLELGAIVHECAVTDPHSLTKRSTSAFQHIHDVVIVHVTVHVTVFILPNCTLGGISSQLVGITPPGMFYATPGLRKATAPLCAGFALPAVGGVRLASTGRVASKLARGSAVLQSWFTRTRIPKVIRWCGVQAARAQHTQGEVFAT